MGCLSSKDCRVVPVNYKRNETESVVPVNYKRTESTIPTSSVVAVCEVSNENKDSVETERKGHEQSHRPAVMRPKTRCIMVRRAKQDSTVDNTEAEPVTSRPWGGRTAHALQPLSPVKEEDISADSSLVVSMSSDRASTEDGDEGTEIPDLVIKGRKILPPLTNPPLAFVEMMPAIKTVLPPLPKLIMRVNGEDSQTNGRASSFELSATNGFRKAKELGTRNINADLTSGLSPLPPNYCSALWTRSDDEDADPLRTLQDNRSRTIRF